MKKKIIGILILTTISGIFVLNEKKDKNFENESIVQDIVVNANKQEDNESDRIDKKEEVEKKEENFTNLNASEYKNKLDKIHNGLKDLNYLYSTGDITKMNAAAGDELKRWDDALNEIYNVLENNLNKTVIDNLKKEQESWIVKRDEKAKKESLEMEGTPSEALLYTQSLSQSTKIRCYELVEKYMNN